jgi:polyhydroxybutyrate depolymerase
MSRPATHHSTAIAALVAIAVFAGACSSDDADGGGTDTANADTAGTDTAHDDTADTANDNAADTAEPDSGNTDVTACAPLSALEHLGAPERPARVIYPAGWDGCTPLPMIIVLHGFSATAGLQDVLFGVGARASAYGYIALLPEGKANLEGNQYWDGGVCCDFAKEDPQDSAYLAGLIDEAVAKLNVDPGRVYAYGHSNGGFMANRLACEHADKVRAFVSLAGAAYGTGIDSLGGVCDPSQPVSALHIHPTSDDTILYDGGALAGQAYPSAEDTVAAWRGWSGCDEVASVLESPADYIAAVDGDETLRTTWACAEDTEVAFWKMVGAEHIPLVNDDCRDDVIAWLLDQR